MVVLRFALFYLCLLAIPFHALPGVAEAKKSLDPYKVLGVDKEASQRDIQKAFHKLSLQYHPDKNKNKGAHEKFAEINNAYDILSDEEKRKNYDLYGDEKPGPGFDAGNFGGGNFGGSQGYGFFTGGGPGGSQYTFRPEGWQGMGGQGNSYSFSFGGGSGPGSGFGFGFNDLFSSFFGSQSKGGSQHSGFGGGQNGGFGNSGGQKFGTATTNIQPITFEIYNKEILDRGLTWILLVYNSVSNDYHMLESLVEDVSSSLQGAIKAGSINCQNERTLCRELGVLASKSARVLVYSYRSSDKGSFVEYNDAFGYKSLKKFCIEQLPKFSKRVTLSNFDFPSSVKGNLPQVLLLSTKRDTPVMWRAVSGMYQKRMIFYDAEVSDAADKNVKKFGVDALPAIVGRLANGEVYVIKNGMTTKDLKTGIGELRSLLDSFEKKNKKVAPRFEKDSQEKVPLLTRSNMDDICGDNTVLCIIGVFRSTKTKASMDTVLSKVSQMTLTRRPNQAPSSSDTVRYGLLDASKQPAFLKSFDGKGFRSSDAGLVAYKPRKGRFAVFNNEVTVEEVERFISSVLNGDIQFSNVRQKPVVK